MFAQKTTPQTTTKRPDGCRDPLSRLAVLLTCLLVGLLAGQPPPVQAQRPDANNVEFVSEMGGNIGRVFVQGDYAYISQANRLTILDITTPVAPTPVGAIAPGTDDIEDIYVSGDLVYVANGENGLRIIDASAPTNPTQIGFLDTVEHAFAVHVSGDLAYVVDKARRISPRPHAPISFLNI